MVNQKYLCDKHHGIQLKILLGKIKKAQFLKIPLEILETL